MRNTAPVAILVYSRIGHLKKTISGLKENTLAKETDLYLFLDGPKPGDERAVETVRRYVYTVDGFRAVHVIERRKNSLKENFTKGMDLLFGKYGKCIYMDDDVVTAPGFLQFMNDALDTYENNENIFSITGFCPPIGANKLCTDDCFILPRFDSWGFGIWEDRYRKIVDIPRDEFFKFARNRTLAKRFVRGGGEDMMTMLLEEVEGLIYTTDVKAMYHQFFSNQYTVYPTVSLLQNIGNDGSGLHCRVTELFNVDLWQKTEFTLEPDIRVNDDILKAHRCFRKISSETKAKECRTHIWGLSFH
jgi:hypothetical protein